MNEPVYSSSPRLWIHRWGSLTFALASLLRYGALHGVGLGIRRHAAIVFSLALIWFAEQLATTAVENSGGWLSPHSADVTIRVCGWILLALMVVGMNIDLLL